MRACEPIGPDLAAASVADYFARLGRPFRLNPAAGQDRSPSLQSPSLPAAQVAQSVEQRIENPRVGSSILSLGTISTSDEIQTLPKKLWGMALKALASPGSSKGISVNCWYICWYGRNASRGYTNIPLSDSQIRGAKPRPKVFKLSDGGGLQLWVSPDGAKRWRLAYRFNRVQKVLAIGVYPAVALRSAREARERARGVLAEGQAQIVPLDTLVVGAEPGQGFVPFRSQHSRWHSTNRLQAGPPGDFAHDSDRCIRTALSGHRCANWLVARMSSGASPRGRRTKPCAPKNDSAVSVRSHTSFTPRAWARESNSATTAAPFPVLRAAFATTMERSNAAAPQ